MKVALPNIIDKLIILGYVLLLFADIFRTCLLCVCQWLNSSKFVQIIADMFKSVLMLFS
jgi:hypothetical protein